MMMIYQSVNLTLWHVCPPLFETPLSDCSNFFLTFVLPWVYFDLSNQWVSCPLIIWAWLVCQRPHHHAACLPPLDCTLMAHLSISWMCVYARTSTLSRIESLCSEWLPLKSANLQTLVLIGSEWKFRFGLEKWIIQGHIERGLASCAAQRCLHGTGEMATWGRGCSTQLQPHVCKGCGAERGCVICQTLNRVLACGQFRSFPVCFSSLAVTVVAALTGCRAALHFCIHKP